MKNKTIIFIILIILCVLITLVNSSVCDDFTINIKIGITTNFTYQPQYPKIGNIVTFTDTSYPAIAINWTWDFGDGELSYQENPAHTYYYAGTFQVTLTVVNEGGVNDTTSKNITVSRAGSPSSSNVAPNADADGPYSGYVNGTITFNGSGSYDSDGSIENYNWDFGDGSIGYGVSPSHTYSSYGTFNVTLTVTDDGGSTGSTETTVTIALSGVDSPVADAGGPYSGLTNQAVAFDGSDSSDSDGSIVNYTWDFGDGNTGKGVTLTHIYYSAGVYMVTLTVTDNDGFTDPDTTTVAILLDSDGDGWSDIMEKSYGTNTTYSNDYPLDTDGDGTPDKDSPDGNYTGDSDDDNDGLEDEIEEMLGSDSEDSTDVASINIEGGYIVDIDGNGQHDKFYNSTSGINTTIEVRDDGKYLLDTDGDGNWNFIYDPASGAITPYEPDKQEGDEFPWLLIIIVVIIVIIVVIFIFFKIGFFYVEKE